MRKILKSDFGPAVAVVLDLLVAYLFFILARVAFLVENRTLFADTLADGNLARIFRGASFLTPRPSSTSTPCGSC